MLYITYLPYARDYNPRFVYFKSTFRRSKTLFKETFFLEILPLCMVSIQERFVINSYNDSSTHMKENVQEAHTEIESV